MEKRTKSPSAAEATAQVEVAAVTAPIIRHPQLQCRRCRRIAGGEKDAGDVEIGEATEADTTWQIDERSIEIPGDYVKKTKTLKRIAREEKMAARKEKMRENKNFICCIIIMMILVIIAAVLASVLTRGSSGSGGGSDGQQGSPSTGGNIPDGFPGATGSSSGTVEDGY